MKNKGGFNLKGGGFKLEIGLMNGSVAACPKAYAPRRRTIDLAGSKDKKQHKQTINSPCA